MKRQHLLCAAAIGARVAARATRADACGRGLDESFRAGVGG